MLKRIFNLLGFCFTVICPLILFGGVIPLTHGGIAAGLTTMGYIVVAIIAVILSCKLYAYVKTRKESLGRGIALFAFPLAWWLIIWMGLQNIVTLINNLSLYWWRVIIFLCIGGFFRICAEAMGEDS